MPFLKTRLLFLLLLILSPLRAFDPATDVKVTLSRGVLRMTFPEGTHLKQRFLQVTLKPGNPGVLELGAATPALAKDELGDPIWQGPIEMPIAGTGLSGTVDLLVKYQACLEGDGGTCFPPLTQTLSVKASEIPRSHAAAAGVPPSSRREGVPWLLLIAFAAGLAASLTPCVYPMIPITMAIIGAKGGGRAKGFALSLTLVLGMSAIYTSLGVFAARTGATFGAFAQKPAFLIPVSLLFAIFALSLFGAFEIQLPAAVQNCLQGSGPRKGFLGAFVMGLVLGPLAAPCVGPVIGSVLVGIAQKGDVVLGALQLFVFSLGMGVLFMIAGTFSASLPRSGDWLTRLKHVMGLVVLGFAAWNVRLVVPEWANLVMGSLTVLVGASVFGIFEPGEGLWGQLRRVCAILLLVVGVLLGVKAAENLVKLELLPRGGAVAVLEPKAGPWMEQDLEAAMRKAKAENKLVLVDIYADWCAQCKELDEKTWPEPAVRTWIEQNAVPVRIDTDKYRPDLAKRLAVQSYPTVLLLEADGRELRRVLGFHKASEMLRQLDSSASGDPL